MYLPSSVYSKPPWPEEGHIFMDMVSPNWAQTSKIHPTPKKNRKWGNHNLFPVFYQKYVHCHSLTTIQLSMALVSTMDLHGNKAKMLAFHSSAPTTSFPSHSLGLNSSVRLYVLECWENWISPQIPVINKAHFPSTFLHPKKMPHDKQNPLPFSMITQLQMQEKLWKVGGLYTSPKCFGYHTEGWK